MKLDPKTITILQNFQSLNPQLAVDKGNILKTLSTTEAVIAKATVPNDFPRSFGINDLSRFLGIYSLFKDSEIEFEEKYLVIKSGASVVKFVYGDTDVMLKPPSKDMKLSSVDIEFELKPEVFNTVLKAMQILGYNEIAITADGENLNLSAVDTKNTTSNVYSVKIGETNKKANFIIEADKLKILPMTYVVQISKEGLALFKGDMIEYWIATKV